MADLVEQVKKLQRESEEWKQAWWQHCTLYGNNTRDPSAHSPEFLRAFLDQPNLPTLNLDEITKVEDPNDHTVLVERIKMVQKTSPEGKLAWVAWCSQKPNGSRDPNLHEPEFLAEFLQSLKAESLAAWSPPAEVKDSKQQLIDQIKNLQRTPEGKEAWAVWCGHYGGGSRDPSVHDASFLQQFLRSQGLMPGKRPVAAMVAGGKGLGLSLGKGKGKGKGGFYEDPAAREELVTLIKAAQRESEEFRYAWAEYCAMYAGNSRDPNLHDLASLQGFVASNPHLMPGAYGYGSPVAPPMAKRGRFMGGPAYPPHAVLAPPQYAPTSAEHAALVEQVKGCQRQGGDWMQAWATFCDSVGAPQRDPAAHPPERLREFLLLHNVTPAEVPAGPAMVAGSPAGMPRRPPRGPFTSLSPQSWANGAAVPRGRPFLGGPRGMF